MNIQKNWWELTSCGINFFNEVIFHLERYESVALIGTHTLPWIEYFFEKLKGSNLSASKAFEIIDATNITQPAEYIFDHYCSSEVQSSYWPEPPSYTHVNFLADTDDIVLNDRFLFVRNINSEQSFLQWFDFVDKYIKCSEKNKYYVPERAVFVLEYTGKLSSFNGTSRVKTVSFNPKVADIFTYNLVNTGQEYKAYLLNKYATELIGELCKENIMCCGFLSEYTNLIRNPQTEVESFSSKYSEFPAFSAEQIQLAVLSAQFKVLLPLIEQKRREFISKYYPNIDCLLPWVNDFGNIKNEPYDMEIRDLMYKANEVGISDSDKKLISFLREARNQIAHNHPLTYDQILVFIN